MGLIGAIAGREIRSYFVGPAAWIILAVVQFIAAYVFLMRLELFLQNQPQLATLDSGPGVTSVVIAPTLGTLGFVVLLVAPVLTMRVFSEERRSHTLNLLLTAPVSLTQIVLGKFFGVMFFFSVMTMMLAMMPLSLLAGAPIDLAQTGLGLVGLWLLLGALTALGLFISASTTTPTIAGVASFGLALFLWMIDWAGQESGFELLRYLSLSHHYQNLLKGLFDSTDCVYFVLLIASGLALTVWRLDCDRVQA